MSERLGTPVRPPGGSLPVQVQGRSVTCHANERMARAVAPVPEKQTIKGKVAKPFL